MPSSNITQEIINLTREVQINLGIEYCSAEIISGLKISIPSVLIGSDNKFLLVSPGGYLQVRTGMKLDLNADSSG